MSWKDTKLWQGRHCQGDRPICPRLVRSDPRRLQQESAGFTLIELLVAMAILTVLMGLSGFAIQAYNRAQALTGAANQVLTDMRDAQVRSQSEVRTYKLVFDVAANRYEIFRVESGPPTFIERVTMAKGIDITSVDFESTGGCFTPNGSNEAFFCPRGVSSSGKLLLRSNNLNQDRQINLKGLTARAELR